MKVGYIMTQSINFLLQKHLFHMIYNNSGSTQESGNLTSNHWKWNTKDVFLFLQDNLPFSGQ